MESTQLTKANNAVACKSLAQCIYLDVHLSAGILVSKLLAVYVLLNEQSIVSLYLWVETHSAVGGYKNTLLYIVVSRYLIGQECTHSRNNHAVVSRNQKRYVFYQIFHVAKIIKKALLAIELSIKLCVNLSFNPRLLR